MSTKPIVRMFAAAVCAGAAGVLTGQVPAHAGPMTPLPLAPKCANWKLNDHVVVLDLANGFRIDVDWDVQGGFNVGTGLSHLQNGDTEWYGKAKGGVVRGDKFDVTITWTEVNDPNYLEHVYVRSPIPPPQPTNHITGDIDPEFGSVRGETVNEKGVATEFVSQSHFSCADASPPPPPPPPPPPAQKADPKPAPVIDPNGPVQAGTSARVVSDVDVYDNKNEPDGAGTFVGILRAPSAVSLLTPCSVKQWCKVSGDAVPTGVGWVWGALEWG